jgi:hypothetical protein
MNEADWERLLIRSNEKRVKWPNPSAPGTDGGGKRVDSDSSTSSDWPRGIVPARVTQSEPSDNFKDFKDGIVDGAVPNPIVIFVCEASEVLAANDGLFVRLGNV